MTMIDTVGRITSIQTTLDQLNGVASAKATKTSATAGASGADSSADFTALLNKALGANGATGVPSGGVPGSEGVTGNAVKDAAMKYIGVPYVFGGEDATGMDCSGLVQRVYADLGIEVPRLVSGQMKIGTEVPSLAQAQPGDLIVTDNADHIVIYAGDNKVIHAPYEGRNVSYVERWFDESDIVTIRRVVPTDGAATAAVGARSINGAASAQQIDPAALESMLAAARATLFSGATR